MTRALDLGVKLFADGADLQEMIALSRQPYIRGFTTNPTLMHKAGVRDYRQFARDVLAAIPNRPISFEVFSDEFDEMAAQAREIASWGPCVYVKIPITNTRGEASYDLIHELSRAGVKVNVTAVLTREQICGAFFAALRGGDGGDRVHFRGTHRRHRPRSGADRRGRRRAHPIRARHRDHLGELARAPQHLPGRRRRLPHHHGDGRHPAQAGVGRPRPRRSLARHRDTDVPLRTPSAAAFDLSPEIERA